MTSCSSVHDQTAPHVYANFKNKNLEVEYFVIRWMERQASIFHNTSVLNIDGGSVVISGQGISLGIEVTGGNVTVLKGLGTEPFLRISIFSAIDTLNQVCGLCGDRQGNLQLKNGQMANPECHRR